MANRPCLSELRTGDGGRTLCCMRPKRFIEAVKHLKFADLLDDERPPSRPEALRGGDGTLGRPCARRLPSTWSCGSDRLGRHRGDSAWLPGGQGSRSRSSAIRAEGYEGWDLRLDGITFSQGPTAELTDLDEAKPNGLEDAPAVLVPYPGRVSWEELRLL
jgi:hypothetical protein